MTEAILAVVDQQMRDNRPPETRRTFERLVALGYTPDDVRRLIGNVVAQEIFAVMQQGQAYSEQRDRAAVRGLPERAVYGHGTTLTTDDQCLDRVQEVVRSA